MNSHLSIILLLATALLISACGGSPSTPETLRDSYVAALKANDMDKALSLSSKKFNERMSKAIESDPAKAKKNFESMCKIYLANLDGAEISGPEIEGDKAAIHYKKGYVTFSFKMVKEGEKWMMDKGSIKDETPLEEQTPAK